MRNGTRLYEVQYWDPRRKGLVGLVSHRGLSSKKEVDDHIKNLKRRGCRRFYVRVFRYERSYTP